MKRTHLSDDDFANYYDGVIGSEKRKESLTKHLASCSYCQEKWKRMQRILGTFEEQLVTEEDKAIIQSILNERGSKKER